MRWGVFTLQISLHMATVLVFQNGPRATLPLGGLPGWDYVLVGRPGATVERPFSDLLADMANALGRVHADRAPK